MKKLLIILICFVCVSCSKNTECRDNKYSELENKILNHYHPTVDERLIEVDEKLIKIDEQLKEIDSSLSLVHAFAVSHTHYYGTGKAVADGFTNNLPNKK